MGSEEVLSVVKIEPVELAIEYDAGEQGEVFPDRESADEARGAGLEGWSAPYTAAGERLVSVKSEPCIEAEPPDYGLSFSEVDVKQEVAASAEAAYAAGAGTIQLTPDVRSHTGPERSSPCSSYTHLGVTNAHLGVTNTPLYTSWNQYTLGEKSTYQDINLRHSSYGNVEHCSIESPYLGQPISLETQERIQTNLKHICPTCGDCFKNLTLFHLHIENNYCSKSYTPSKSGAPFSNLKQSKGPLKIQRNKPHICLECNKSFTNQSKLNHHMTIHTGEKPHPCHECGKSFPFYCNLRDHMTVHTGEKPHTCQECGKSFTQSGSFRRHIAVHTGEKPHACQECGKCFSLSINLRRHMIVHTGEKPHTCQECGKTFAYTSSLNNHMTVHTGEKPYTCQECGKSFTQSGNFRRHMLVHTGEKPHTCQECGKSYKRSSNLRTHMAIHAGEKPHNLQDHEESFISQETDTMAGTMT